MFAFWLFFPVIGLLAASRTRRAAVLMVVLSVAVLAATLASCGGGGGGGSGGPRTIFGTPKGTYKVNAIASCQGSTKLVSLTLTVQ